MADNATMKKWYDIAKWLRRFKWDNHSNHDYGPQEPELETVKHLDQADIYSSEIQGSGKMQTDPFSSPRNVYRHMVALDLDIPAVLVPSSTEGHHHLLIDVDLSEHDYMGLLKHLGELGIIEKGYAEICTKRKASHLRAPWKSKFSVVEPSIEQRVFKDHVKTRQVEDELLNPNAVHPPRPDQTKIPFEILEGNGSGATIGYNHPMEEKVTFEPLTKGMVEDDGAATHPF